MKVGDLVRHVGFGDLLGIVTEIDSRYRDKRFMEVIRESR